ncbi:hypothetical protein [Gordonia sp. CPCC 205333]|uniref:hypothetical protein n=1 Tax=Gordonia sp. CPCC 205333 TaxID=3140790 RepID=UPI003AF3B23C
MAGQTGNRVKNILWGLFVGLMGVGMIIGGIVSISAKGKPECNGRTITEDYVCVTDGVERTGAEQAAENESSSHKGGWILLGIGVVLAGGSLAFFSDARGASRRANPAPPQQNPWPVITPPVPPQPTYPRPASYQPIYPPQQPVTNQPPPQPDPQQPPGPPKIDYRKRH